MEKNLQQFIQCQWIEFGTFGLEICFQWWNSWVLYQWGSLDALGTLKKISLMQSYLYMDI